ncbi:peptidase C14 caspase catalytic subunit p20 [Calothrix parasitica NIES-267]|uniref:Peptidase C14 caspase catalytic subunit p20 n=1 Tax=Calothrix parasitica NIES-267 TaxID=1973488 RepID=A0A1Z4LVF5_9CYAN|nr:peptidase C14 caspase catalytic subunit p20 [Calothrix parasitica NIES-267]
MKRRIFLQRIGSILAVMGITESSWWTKADGLQQALADTTPRKLALLVGINQYPQIPALKGCLTDVELQRELLIHRFGFQPSDILSLTNKQATREGIENAFVEHLINQAKPGDVVIFHFSGYGSRIKNKNILGGMENALIPIDGSEAIEDSETIANYLLEDTLLLMLQSLATERATAILDTSYYRPSISQPAGLRYRCWKAPLEGLFLAEEIEFQKQLTKKIAPDKLSVLLASSSSSKDVAKEIVFSDFSAGLFTYALTQYLWETTAAKKIQINLSRVGSSMLSLGNKQEPVLLKKSNQAQALIAANVLSKPIKGAEGTVTNVEDDGKTVHLWLGGIPPHVLEYYGVNSRFTFYSAASPSTTPLVLRSRNGLKAKATLKQVNNQQITPQIGQMVRERVRVLPKEINLTIALDDVSLERIERVDATSAFASINRVDSVIAGEQPADYLFGKLPETEVPDTEVNNAMAMSSSSRYGLFTLGGELIPDTLGEEGEALKVAVYRLAPKLKTLLAAKLWKLTQNETSSGLSVKVTLEVINKKLPRTLIQRQTKPTLGMETSTKKVENVSSPGIPTVSTGSKMRYRVENTGDRPLYIMLLGLNNSNNPIALYPWYKDEEAEENSSKPKLKQVVIPPGETLTIPKTIAGSEWVMSGPDFWCENQIILSTSAFTKTLAALDEGKHSSRETHRISPLLNPLEVASSLLQDLNQASITKDETQNSSADSWMWNVNHWVSFSFLFQVV